MRSAAEPIITAFGRSSDLLDQVDYRLAQTPEEKEGIYNLRYRAYLREGAVKESADQRVTDQYDDLSNSWTFGIYIRDELFSSVRISVLTREWRQSCSAEAFGEILFPRLDRGEIIIDPTRFVADPEKAKRFPELFSLYSRVPAPRAAPPPAIPREATVSTVCRQAIMCSAQPLRVLHCFWPKIFT